jgi:hypothetical protein
MLAVRWGLVMWWTKERDVVERLCRFPLTFRGGGKSLRGFVEATGIVKHPSALTVESLLPYIKEHPQLIGAWMVWSSDKRVSSGWYFKPSRTGGYEVGYYPRGERLQFNGIERACAEFIVRELGPP